MRILVTGATGFVGRVVVRRLLAGGHSVRATFRNKRPEARVEAVAVGDIGPETDWREITDGVDAVVHLAARVHVMRDSSDDPLADFRRVNRDGTRMLAESCRGIQRFVFMSSIKAQVDEATDGPVDERSDPRPTSPYGVSKLEGERALAQAADRHGFAWLAIRPPLVFGAGVKGNFERLIRLVRRGLPLPLGAIRNRRSLIYVENLADAVARGLEPGAPSGIALPLTDGPPRSTTELLEALGAAMGRRPRLVPVPAALLGAGARLLGRADLWARLGGDLEIRQSVRQRLGWEPPIGFEEAIRRTVRDNPSRPAW